MENATAAAESPAAAYRQRLTAVEAAAQGLARRSQRLSYARGASFFAGVAAAFGVLWRASAPGVTLPALTVLAFAAFAVLAIVHSRVLRDLRRQQERARINREALARLERDWDGMPLPELADEASASPTARDLDLFGHASLFHLLGTARTPPGKTQLSRWLREGAPPQEVARRQAAVEELAGKLDLRQELELLARPLDAAHPDPEPFLEWAADEAWLTRRPALLWGSRGLAVASLLLFAGVGAGLVPFSAWGLLLVANFAVTRLWGGGADAVFQRVTAREGGFSAYGRALALLEGERFRSPLLEDLSGELAAGGLPAARWMAKLAQRVGLAEARRTGAVHFLLQVALLWDFHVLWLLERWQLRAGPFARTWLSALGRIEALAALGGLARDNPEWAFPEIRPDGPALLEGRELGHPLLPPGSRVGNDVTLGPPGTALLVTGSNMSGKSTLLRALGVNAVLAQAGGPVCARSLALPPVVLGTSILVEDSLETGISYFMAELRRVKGIVELARQNRAGEGRTGPGRDGEGRRLLFLLDEILRGTNSAERRVAVRRVLRHLLEEGAIGAVSTHDLELARDPELAPALVPVHFRETIRAGADGPPMTFDYQLRPGVATTTNALALLDLVGLGEEGPRHGGSLDPAVD